MREAAVHRRSEAALEVDELRKAVGQRCATALQQMKSVHTTQELAAAWHDFAAGFETHAAMAKVREQHAPGVNDVLEQVRPVYLKLVQSCQNATAVR
ncbi:MAG: hypothetical protein KGN36_15810 [Acidobacteriota bacterium]|nr:hypothetical protein [Acidobacteriota bacterium]